MRLWFARDIWCYRNVFWLIEWLIFSRRLWFCFFLYYIISSILELHSCTMHELLQSGVNLFSLSIHIGSTLKQLCVVRHCVSTSWRVCTFLDCLCWNCFAVTNIRSTVVSFGYMQWSFLFYDQRRSYILWLEICDHKFCHN